MLAGLHYSEEVYRHLRFLETIIDSLSEGVAVGHKHEGLVLFNSAARDILGLTITRDPPKEWGKFYGLYYPDGTEIPWEELPMVQALAGKMVRRLDILINNPVTQGRMISADAYPISDVLGIVVFRDVTQERQREQALEIAKEAAEVANRAKSQFLANMSHEIRTPIGIVLGFARMLRDATHLTGENSAWLSIIQRNAEHLTSLVDGVLDLSKIEAGQLRLERKWVLFSRFVEETLDPLRRQAVAKGLCFLLRIDPGIPRFLHTDETALRRVLINVVGNAIKFTEKGAIEVTAHPTDEGVELAVRDSGIGIDPRFFDQLFRPFSQADSSMARRYGGTGLGLIVSRHLMEALGGALKLEKSEPGLGSTFIIQMGATVAATPLVEPQEAPMRFGADADRLAFFNSQPLAGLTVLVVEDNEDNQLLLTHLLRRAGASVLCAADGEQGVQLAQTEHVDLVVMDIQMPGLDGYQATQKLREEGFQKPIVALTAHALREEYRKCLLAGCNEYLSKPVNPVQFIEVLGHLTRGAAFVPPALNSTADSSVAT